MPSIKDQFKVMKESLTEFWRCAKSASANVFLLTLFAFSFVLTPNSARAEGAWQLGLFESASNRQPIQENNITGNYFLGFVDILAPGEVINVFLCGTRNSHDMRVDIRDPSGAVVFSETRTSSNVNCADNFDAPWDPATTDPFQYVTGSSGTYELRFFNLNATQFNRYDVTVTDTVNDLIDPQENGGRLWTTVWRAWAGGFGEDRATDADLYVVVDGGFAGTFDIWQLDLNNFAGFGYRLKANDKGVTNNDPNTNVSGLSVPTGNGNINQELYPMYVSYPAKNFPRATQTLTVDNFRFLDDEGLDATISPASTGNSQDSGSFFFETNNTSTAVYEIVLDIGDGIGGGPDGIYGAGDVFLIDNVIEGGGTTQVTWNGRDNEGNLVPFGFYNARLRVRIGEFHFVAEDVETSGGPNDRGIKINKAISATTVTPTIVFWDDFTVQNSNEPDAFNVDGIFDGEHSWGAFNSGGPGNNAFIDTYTYSQTTTPNFINVGIVSDDFARPTIVKSFSPAVIVSGNPSTMSFEITNNDSNTITGVSFNDSFPQGMILSQDPATMSVTGAGCSGFVTDAATVNGGSQFNVTGGSIPGNGVCTVEIDVTATLTDLYDNVTSSVVFDQASDGPSSNTATLRIVPGASGPPLVCDATTYVSEGASSTRLHSVDRTTAVYSHNEFSGINYAPTTGYTYDALGFNPVDDYLYAVVRDTSPGEPSSGSLLRIDAGGGVINLGRPVQGPQLAVMPTFTTRYVGGAFGPDGLYYVVTDADTSAPLAERSRILVLDVGTSTPQIITNFSHGRDLKDIAVHPDGTVFGYTSANQLVTIDPNTGSSAVIGSGNAGTDIAGMSFDANGVLTLTQESTGVRYTIDLITGQTQLIASGPALPEGDVASCPFYYALDKRAVPSDAIAGGETTYEFTLHNSTSVSETFNLSDTLSDGRTFVAGSLVDPSGSAVNAYDDTNTLSITGINIPAQSSQTISVAVNIPATTPIGSIFNQASMSSGGVTIVSDDVSTGAFGDPTLVNVADRAALGVAKSATLNPANSQEVIFAIQLDNLGTVDLNNLSVLDELDSVLGIGTYTIIGVPSIQAGSDPGTLSINTNFTGRGSETDLLVPSASSLIAGASAVLNFTVRVDTVTDQGLGTGFYENQVTASATDPLGSIHTDLSDSGTITDSDGDGIANESIAAGQDSDENDKTIFLVPSPNGPIVSPVSLSKTFVDVNGGDIEPGDTLRYTLTVLNSQATAVTDLTVVDNLPTLLSNFSLLSSPLGATPSFLAAPAGANGNGLLSVSDLDISGGTSASIVFDVTIDPLATVGTVITNTATVDYPAGDNDSDDVSAVVNELFVPSVGIKPLYLGTGTDLTRQPLSSNTAATRVDSNNSARWNLAPVTTDTLTFDAGVVPVFLWVESDSAEDFPVQIQLKSIGSTVIDISDQLSQTITIQQVNVPQFVRLDLTVPVSVSLAAGSQVQFEFLNNHTSYLDIHPFNGTNSRIEPVISTVINVDSLDTLDAPAPGGNAQTLFYADDIIHVSSTISDPFGQADISDALFSVRDPSGAIVFGPASMGAPISNTAGTKTYAASYTLPSTVDVGLWRVVVTGVEGTEGTVTHSAFKDISVGQVPLDYGDAPDLAAGVAPGDYRTRESDNGPSHEIVADLLLGSSVDAELDGFVNGEDSSGDASDDDSENGDDEDGITFTTLVRAGLTANASVQAVNGTGSTAYLNAWIDFNADGDFNGAGEQIATDLIVGTGNTSLGFTVPEDAAVGGTFARFRYSLESGLNPEGPSTSGEVEDYPVLIEVPGFLVTGRVFNDKDVNGFYDGSDAGLSGVAVVLQDNVTNTCVSASTDGEGLYRFERVLDGNYTVYESAYASLPVPDICPPAGADLVEHLSVSSNAIAFTVNGANVVNGLDFSDVKASSLSDEHVASVSPGSSTVYQHRFLSPSAGSVEFSLQNVNSPLNNGWSSLVYLDATCNAELGSDDPQISGALSVNADETLCVLVRVFAPAVTTAGARNLSTLTSTFSYADPSALGHGLQSTRERTDITTTTAPAAGRLVLDKFVQNTSEGEGLSRTNSADVGDILRYTVAFENAGAGGVSDVRIKDVTPAFTSLATPVSCPATLPPGITSCSVEVPSAGGNALGYEGPIEWRFVGRLLAGGGGELTFDVRVD